VGGKARKKGSKTTRRFLPDAKNGGGGDGRTKKPGARGTGKKNRRVREQICHPTKSNVHITEGGKTKLLSEKFGEKEGTSRSQKKQKCKSRKIKIGVKGGNAITTKTPEQQWKGTFKGGGARQRKKGDQRGGMRARKVEFWGINKTLVIKIIKPRVKNGKRKAEEGVSTFRRPGGD